jgi:hypothetical protein
MPTRVHILKRIIQAVAISVKALRVSGIRNYAIRADKPPYRWVIVTGIIVVKAGGVKVMED